jgi:hypothetical protein
MEEAPDPRRTPRTARREELPPAEQPPAEDARTRFEEASSGCEDLPPGAYLREIRVGTANVVWACVNLAVALGVSAAWISGALGPQSEWRFLAHVAWTLLPPSCGILFLLTLWQVRVGARDQGRWRALVTVGLCVLAIAVWWWAGDWGGVDFSS